MKKTNHSFLKKFNVVLIALLGIIGFSSCEREDIVYDKPMYGTPYSAFSTKSSVISEKNDEYSVFLNDTMDEKLTPEEEEID
jgi:putative lipoprotein (rSAM/lipoprotein system)